MACEYSKEFNWFNQLDDSKCADDENGLDKTNWKNIFTTARIGLFPLTDCLNICRKNFPKSLEKLFKEATFDSAASNIAQLAQSSLDHVLSYSDIRTFVCEKLNEYYQHINNPNTANQRLDQINQLIALLFTPDPQARVNYEYDEDDYVELNLNGDNEILHTGKYQHRNLIYIAVYVGK